MTKNDRIIVKAIVDGWVAEDIKLQLELRRKAREKSFDKFWFECEPDYLKLAGKPDPRLPEKYRRLKSGD